MAQARKRRAANGRGRGSNGGTSHQFYNDILSLAGGLMSSRKEQGAESLSAIAEATRDYADRLHMPNIGNYVSSAADQLDYLSEYMGENDFETMIEDAGHFAKRHPFAMLGLAAAAGLGITRMMMMNDDSPRHQGNSRSSTSTATRRRPSTSRGGKRSQSARRRTSTAESASA
jgi:hypothetical protein